MNKVTTVLVICLFALSCKKTQFDEVKTDNTNLYSQENTSALNARMNNENTDCEDCDALNTSYADTIDHPTIMGGGYSKPLYNT